MVYGFKKMCQAAVLAGCSVPAHMLWTGFRNLMSKGIAGYPMGGHTSMSLPFGTHSPTICLWVSFGWVLLEQGFSEWVLRAFCTDACSHVPGLVSEEDYGICHSNKKYKRRNALWS